MQLSFEAGDPRSQLDPRLRPSGTRAEQDMVDNLSARTQLVHQLEHRYDVACGADPVRSADADEIRFAACCVELPGKLARLRVALRAIDPMLSGAEEMVEQKISRRHFRFCAVQNQLALKSRLRRRRGRLSAMV